MSKCDDEVLVCASQSSTDADDADDVRHRREGDDEPGKTT